MARDIRFYLDENVHRFKALATGLRRLGIDVQTVLDAGKRCADDDEQFQYAQETTRVLFTNDADFLSMASNQSHVGLVFCPRRKLSMGQVIQRLELIWELLDPEDMHNNVEYL